MPYNTSVFAPEHPLPGFPLNIVRLADYNEASVTNLMRVFRSACEQGNMPLANDTFVALRAAVNEYALHHFEAVAAHMQAVTLALGAPSDTVFILTPDSPDDRNSDSDGEEP